MLLPAFAAGAATFIPNRLELEAEAPGAGVDDVAAAPKKEFMGRFEAGPSSTRPTTNP